MSTICGAASWRAAAAMAALALFGGQAMAADFPSRQIELIVPFQPGGGTDGVARAFAEAARTHIPRSIVVLNKPGASGAIGWTEMINAKPDGYKLAVVTVELVTLKPMGLAKFNQDDIQPIIQFNADPAAITVHADAPWNTLQEFLADARKTAGKVSVGNAGNGSIWHFAAAALGEKTGIEFNHIPFQGASPTVQALLGKHVDAVAVSPAEVAQYVLAGKLKMLGVMADQRVKNFAKGAHVQGNGHRSEPGHLARHRRAEEPAAGSPGVSQGRVAQSDRRARLPRGSGEAVPGLLLCRRQGLSRQHDA